MLLEKVLIESVKLTRKTKFLQGNLNLPLEQYLCFQAIYYSLSLETFYVFCMKGFSMSPCSVGPSLTALGCS